jgi:hypothetical protein
VPAKPDRPTSTKPNRHDESAVILRRAVGQLTQAVLVRMESDKHWFRRLSAEQRSWVGLITQAGVRGFADWYAAREDPGVLAGDAGLALAEDLFGAAPRTMAGVVNLQQTVELVRLGIDVVEENLDPLLGKARARDVHAALLRYGREIGFATAEVYARAAELRGAWDARLEALVVDAVLRADHDDTLPSRASALGWAGMGAVVVVMGRLPEGSREVDVFEGVRRSARAADLEALCAAQGDRMVIVLGGVKDAVSGTATVVDHFGPGPVVHGPMRDDLADAHSSATAAASGLRAAAAWPAAPRPVSSDELLPERALAGDTSALTQLVAEVYRPLEEARGTLVETLESWFDNGGSIEATARALFVHPNTVRYRLRQAADLTGLTPSQPRDAYALRLGLTLGRLTDE